MSHEGKMSRGLRFSKMTNPDTGELIDACKNNPRIMETIAYFEKHSKVPKENIPVPKAELKKEEVSDKGKKVK